MGTESQLGTDEMKRCAACHNEKPLGDFYRHRRSPDGRGSYCKPCSSARHLEWRLANADKVRAQARARFAAEMRLTPDRVRARNRLTGFRRRGIDITLEEYNRLLLTQGGVCAICQEPCSTGRNLAVDHDHKTGRVRGLLCSRCNSAIGLLRDDPAIAYKAEQYLLADAIEEVEAK